MESPREVDLYGRRIGKTVDELVACLEGLDGDSLNWSPLVVAGHAAEN